jgi:hypothetical protein
MSPICNLLVVLKDVTRELDGKWKKEEFLKT